MILVLQQFNTKGENLKSNLMDNEEIMSVPDWANLQPSERKDPQGREFWTLLLPDALFMTSWSRSARSRR